MTKHTFSSIRLWQALCLLSGLALTSTALMAQTQPHNNSGTGERPRHGPPPEALTACQGRAMQDTCNFTGAHGAMNGTCWQPDASKPLACRPAHGGPEQGQGQGKSQKPAQK